MKCAIKPMKYLKNNFYTHLFLTIALMTCLLPSPSARAGESAADIPQPLSKALTIYKKGGTEGFIEALIRGGPLAGNREIRGQALILEKIGKYYGAYQSLQIVKVNKLSESTRLIYFLMNYEKGPVFGKLTAYKNGDLETITSFQFHTKPEEIFPEALLVGR